MASKKMLGQIQIMLNVAAHGENPKDTPAIRALAKEVVTVSEKFSQNIQDFYFGRKQNLLERSVALRVKVQPLVARTSTTTGVAVGYWPFPEKPWLNNK